MKFDIEMSEEEILREIREHHIDGIASRVMLEVQTLNVLGQFMSSKNSRLQAKSLRIERH